MPNLLVEAGNTALKAAWAEGTTLGKTFRYQGERMMDYLLSLLEKERPEVLTVAYVRPSTINFTLNCTTVSEPQAAKELRMKKTRISAKNSFPYFFILNS